MWIFLSDAFLSIVDKGVDGTTLLVRARNAGDLERVFPEADVQETPHNDYRYRARLPRERVAQALADAVRDIRYPNFKDTVQSDARHEAYMDVWGSMYRFQRIHTVER